MKKILEIGCGHGFRGSYLSKRGDYIGIDCDEENIKLSKKRYPGIHYQIGNAEHLQFSNSYFDEIHAIEVLEHVNNIRKVLSEIERVIKPIGKLIISFPHPVSEAWLLKLRPTYFKEMHHVRIIDFNILNIDLEKKGFVLKRKKLTGFLQHVELYFLFKKSVKSKKQTSIGNWRENPFSYVLHILLLFLSIEVLYTPLKYFPIWLITIPIGFIIDSVGSRIFPKTIYLEYEYSKE